MKRKRGKERPFLSHFLWHKLKKLFFVLFLVNAFPAISQSNEDFQPVIIHTYEYIFDSTAVIDWIEFPSNVSYSILQMYPLKIVLDSGNQLPMVVYIRPVSPQLVQFPGLYDLSIYEPTDVDPVVSIKNQNFESPVGLLDSYPELYKVGSISRGFTVGNRQNLYVNSSLNLQLQGEISDDLKLTASITDQNIPYQPEGNTQQLRDFDNVFIRLEGKKSKITAGDIAIQNSDYPYFLRYYKNQQGFQLIDQRIINNRWQSSSQTSIGIAKGKFASIQLQPIEGVNGPYRLRGAQNERFIITIANSEKIYLDGKELKRGYNEDYIIDYNLSEITFTSRVIITRFSRLRADFEYTNLDFQRSNFNFYQSISDDKNDFYLEYFKAQDLQKQPLQYSLDDSLLVTVNSIGDLNNESFIYNQENLTDQQLAGNYYIKKDTIIDGQSFTFYQYATSGSNLYQLSFTETEIGNYIIKSQNAYGRIYEFIPPIGGIPQGNYSPGKELTLPQNQSLITLGNNHKIKKNWLIHQELAISQLDKNTFSNQDDDDNTGLGWKGGINFQKVFSEKKSFKAGVTGEYNSAHFKPIDRFRTIEFDRDWNYPFPYDSIDRSEKILYSNAAFVWNQQNIQFRSVYRERASILQGWQHYLNQRHQLKFLYYQGDHFLMNNQQIGVDSKWLRSFNEAFVKIKSMETGVFFRIDQNLQKKDSAVIGSAMFYSEQGYFIRQPMINQIGFDLEYADREDYRPVNGENISYTDAQQYKGSIHWNNSSNNQSINFQGIYRDTERIDSLSLPQDHIIQGSLQMNNRIGDGLIKNRMSYMTQNSRELRREFIYTQVGAGQGTHTWRDENGNGIAEIDEFYEAINPDERNYIRLFVPSDQYEEAFLNQYQHAIDWTFQNLHTTSKILHPIKNLSGLFNWNIQSKSTATDFSVRTNPFNSLADSVLISKRNLTSFGVFYNRYQKGLGFSFQSNSKENKQLNVNGFESDNRITHNVGARYMFANQLQIEANHLKGKHNHSADFLQGRNFNIHQQHIHLLSSLMPNQNARFTIEYFNRNNQNKQTEQSEEYSKVQEWKGGITYIQSGKRNLSMELSFINIDFSGQTNSYLGYVLLDALQPGQNLKFHLNLNQTLKNGLQLSMNYFGRKSENQPVIHSGSMNLTAFF